MDNVITDGSLGASEKMLPQSQVNELIGGAKAAAADKAAREVEAKYQQQISEYEEKLKSLPDEEALIAKLEQRRAESEAQKQKAAEEAEIQRQFDEVAKKYDQKLYASRDISPDFDDLMKKFPHKSYQALVIGTADLPNTGEVMLYMAKNRSKAHLLKEMANNDWDGFMDELNEISKTLISQRESSANKVKAPLSKLKSDVVGLNNGGKRTLDELRMDKKSLRL